jgi:hypothetical protein
MILLSVFPRSLRRTLGARRRSRGLLGEVKVRLLRLYFFPVLYKTNKQRSPLYSRISPTRDATGSEFADVNDDERSFLNETLLVR